MFANRTIARFAFALVVLASLFFTSLGITPVHAAGIVVNTAVDESTTNGFCSLREAIINANNNAATYPDCATGSGIDTITFAGNYTITLAGAQLPAVTSPIAINGKGAVNTIIQANASPNTATYRVFLVSGAAADLTLDSLTVRHGRCNTVGCHGGGINSSNASSLTVTNSTISGNNATNGGGGIFSEFNTVTVTNSTISGNSATYGGGIYSEQNTVTVTNSTISGNSASVGGGIYTYGSTLSLSIANSLLSGNSAASNGGGIYNNTSASLSIWGSTLSANSAAEGGALYNNGNMWISNSTLSGNEAYDYGGGIYSEGSAWIHNSSILFNTLIEGTELGAGGIDGDVALYNSLVAGNTRLLTSTYQDCSGTIYSEGHNLFSAYTNCTFNVISGYVSTLNSLSLLGPLQNNGGPTSTHALLPGSNAIDTGYNNICEFFVYNLDQRGVTRPQGSQCDVGAYEAPAFSVIDSVAAQDGWILESSETSNTGGKKNNAASTFKLGDDAANRQYRAILSFDTSVLPDDATIVKVTLVVKKAGIAGGGNPINIFKGFMVDIKQGNFGTVTLALGDFKAKAGKTLGPFKPALSDDWYLINMTNGKGHINLAGNTQIRLRFKLDDNNNSVANILKLYSGDAEAANRPYLMIEYYTP
jgi:CSLREA domain-containing protein